MPAGGVALSPGLVTTKLRRTPRLPSIPRELGFSFPQQTTARPKEWSQTTPGNSASNIIVPNVATADPFVASITGLLATNPAPTADDTNIIARNTSPLPMNTDEKNLSSNLPNPSRTIFIADRDSGRIDDEVLRSVLHGLDL